MKILLVTNVYVPKWEANGTTNFVEEQIKAIQRYNNDISIDQFIIKGFDGKMNYLKTINTIRKEVNSGKYDLVHIHYGLSGLFLLGGFKPKVPIVMTLHGGDIQSEQGHYVQVFFTKRILKKCTAAITLSERMDSIVKKICNKTAIIPCSIETDFFRPLENKVINDNIKKIVFPASRNKPVKDYPLFERVIKVLRNKYKYKIEVIELVNLTRTQVRDVLQVADMMILSSISEGSPGVVKEAMSLNLPVICTNVGDVKYNLEGVANSAVATTRDENEIAQLCDQSFKGLIKGISGREKIKKLGIDDESISRKIASLYAEVL